MSKHKQYKDEHEEIEKLRKILDPNKFIEKMVQIDEADKTDSYTHQVHGNCNNAVAWSLIQLKETFYQFKAIAVVGTYQGKDHAWILIDNIILDLTIAQFEDDASKLNILQTQDAHGYQEIHRLTPREFIEMRM